MSFHDLNKDWKIKSTVRHLAAKFGDKSFKIKDHWDGDVNAIGLVDNDEKFLVYFSARGDNDFYVSLENLEVIDDLPYKAAGDFDNVDLLEFERILIRHLRIKTTDAQQDV